MCSIVLWSTKYQLPNALRVSNVLFWTARESSVSTKRKAITQFYAIGMRNVQDQSRFLCAIK